MNLKEALREWTDWDGAEFALAVSLGIVEDGPGSFQKNKGIFWSNNPVGEELARSLQGLLDAGLLEHRSEPDSQYRWATTEPMAGNEIREDEKTADERIQSIRKLLENNPCHHPDEIDCVLCDVREVLRDNCEHSWVDARNDVVVSGEWCPKCGSVRAGNVTSEREPR